MSAELISDSQITAIYKLLSIHNVPSNLIMVRLSKRAKHLIFQTSLVKGVEIVVPHVADYEWLMNQVHNKIQWIADARKTILSQRNDLTPKQIHLTAINEIWNVKLVPVNKTPTGVSIAENHILMTEMDSQDVFNVARNLQKWIHQKAKVSLVPWMEEFAQDRGLKFNTVRIKNQVSRWGSCSDKGNINLNGRLLFLPRHLVNYVLHHELTHIEHLNHSRRFWEAFSKIVPDCRDLRQELKCVGPDVTPLWALPIKYTN